ncbi:MAG: DUF655 domain-containing protein, partial [Nitrospiraceae bacterium]|nr:DUF655 domain-containing protein [Nitrospiraceae bacterium]
VYIGEGKRDKVHHILGKISYNRLTETAKTELLYVLMDIIKKNEKKFVDFINNARPITTRMHSLELLPGLGKRRIEEILEERDKKPFESLEGFKSRIKQLPDPEEIFAKRIIEELKEPQKHYLFVKWKESKNEP